MKFKFRFESLLKLKRHRELMEKQKMGVLAQKKNEVVLRLEMEEASIANSFDHISDELSSSIHHVRLGYQFMHDKKKSIETLKEEIKAINQEIEAQQKELVKANKQVKTMELIRDKDLEKFKKEQEMEEQFQLNEIATQMYNRTH